MISTKNALFVAELTSEKASVVAEFSTVGVK